MPQRRALPGPSLKHCFLALLCLTAIFLASHVYLSSAAQPSANFHLVQAAPAVYLSSAAQPSASFHLGQAAPAIPLQPSTTPASQVRNTPQQRAITSNGLLPYRLCGAENPVGGAGILTARFSFGGLDYAVLSTAASVHGQRSPHPRVELLAYIQRAGQECLHGNTGCYLPHGAESTLPSVPVACTLTGSSSSTNSCTNSSLGSNATFPGAILVPNVLNKALLTIECPLDAAAEALLFSSQQQRVSLTVGLGETPHSRPLQASLCLQHVPQVFTLAACTQPLYNPAGDFFTGVPPFPTDLLSTFLLYHTRLAGIEHITVNTFTRTAEEEAAFAVRLTPFLAGTGASTGGRVVAHRGFWNLPWEGTAWKNGPLDFEDLAEATCAWEHRLDSRWVILCVLCVCVCVCV